MGASLTPEMSPCPTTAILHRFARRRGRGQPCLRHAPARAKPPARCRDLWPSVSCDTPPVFVLKFTRDGYVSLPIADAGLSQSQQINYFQLQGSSRGEEGGRSGAPAPWPGLAAVSSSSWNMKGDDSQPSDPF